MYVPLVKLSMVKEKELPYGKKTLEKPAEVAEFARQLLEGADKEHLVVIPVDARTKPVAIEIVAIGSVDGAVVEPREVFKSAILNNAAAIFIVHNHPSGDVEPSREDFFITQRLRQAGTLLGIEVLDHIIIGDDDKYLSMKENNWFV